MTYWGLLAITGLSFSMLLFLLSSGLSLIFGLMRIINLAHGTFYLVAAYVGLTVMRATQSFLLSLIVATALVTVIGLAMERGFLKRLYRKELAQVLLTFGFLLILSDLTQWIWGGEPQIMPKPALFAGAIHLGNMTFPSYRILVIVVGLVVAAILGAILQFTPLGTKLRAGVDDAEMALGLGVNVPRIFTGVFAAGAFLAGLGGVMGAPIIGANLDATFEILLFAFVVVIVGGIGSLKGAFLGSLFVGLVDTIGKSLFPEYSLFTVFAPMALMLVIRPRGLFGRK